MPIIEIEIVSRPDEALRSGLAGELADKIAEILNTPPGTTWVRVRTIGAEQYAENNGQSSEVVYPVFASILKARLPSPDEMQAEVIQLTRVLAQVCDRPQENVHIIYLPEGAGRVAFGGRIIPG